MANYDYDLFVIGAGSLEINQVGSNLHRKVGLDGFPPFEIGKLSRVIKGPGIGNFLHPFLLKFQH